MVGARDNAEALREAMRSTRCPTTIDALEVWNGTKYVAAKEG
jgi:hypothetical protein